MLIEDTSQVADTASPAERRTRERVLAAVTLDGPVTASELGSRLGLTAAAVRRHLDTLAAQGAVREHDPAGATPRGRGRPARRWVLSGAGHDALTSGYGVLAAEALRFLGDTAGPDTVAEFARERFAGQERRYAGQLAGVGEDPRVRAEALVEALSRDGFAATARPIGSGDLAGIQLCQGHCPLQQVAAEFPELCHAETEAFSRLLGVHVQRLSTLASGQHVCTTFVPTPASGGTLVPTPASSDKERSAR